MKKIIKKDTKKLINGFTLIELLAVITIISILLLFIVPKVTDVVKDSANDSYKNSVLSIDKTADLYYSKNIDDDNKNGVFDGKTNVLDIIKTSGKKPQDGYVVVTEKGEVAIGAIYNNKCFIKGFEDDEVTVEEDVSSCDEIPVVIIKGEQPDIKHDPNLPEVTCENELTLGNANQTFIDTITKAEGLKKNNNCAGTVDYRYRDNSNNFLLFNGEKWRILGLINGYVKIVKQDDLPDLLWDTAGGNDWENSSMQKYLNGEYYNSFTDEAKTMIQEATYNLGTVTSVDTFSTNDIYMEENSGTSEIKSKISLMYPTDYIYTVPYKCDYTPADYEDDDSYYYYCSDTWLYSYKQHWTVSNSVSNGEVYIAGDYGVYSIDSNYVGYMSMTTRPVLYLKSNVAIKSGEGTSISPYILEMQ